MKGRQLGSKSARLCGLGSAAILLCSLVPTGAATLNWTNTAGGSWETPGNWNPSQSPAAGDVIRIVLGQNFLVNVDNTTASNAANPWLSVNDIRLQGSGGGAHPILLLDFTNSAAALVTTATGTDSFELRDNSETIISNGTLIVNGLLRVGTLTPATFTVAGGNLVRTNGTQNTSVGAPSTLIVSGGRYLFNITDVAGKYIVTGGTNESTSTGNGLTIGNTAGSDGLMVMNGGTLLLTNSGATIRIGNSGRGTLIQSNGTIQVQAVTMGDNSGGAGTWNIVGGTASLGSTLRVGNQSSATSSVLIANSGLLELKSSVTLGHATAGLGSITNRDGGTVRFTGLNNPTITKIGGSVFAVENATVEFKDVTLANLTGNITTLNYAGNNTLSLHTATNVSVASYTFQTNTAPNFAHLRLNNGRFVSTTTTIGSGGSIRGNGTVASTTTDNSGLISPGFSAGELAFTGGLTLQPTSVLAMEIGGTGSSDYDQISVGGALAVDGTLDVSFINAFNPSDGDSFDLLDFASLTGTFGTLNLPALGGGLLWDTTQLYSAGVLSVTVPEPSVITLLAWAAILRTLRRR
jgi:hypothetical protein